jgi:excisionase family DNA binding protein
MMIDPKFLTVGEFAAIMRVSKPTAYRLIDSGEIEAVRIGGTIRIPEKVVTGYLEQSGLAELLEQSGLPSPGRPAPGRTDPAAEVQDAVRRLAAHLPAVYRKHQTVTSVIAVWSDGSVTAEPADREPCATAGQAPTVAFLPPALNGQH